MSLVQYISSLSTTSNIYIANRFLYGLRFFIPVWLIFYLNYITISQVGLMEAAGMILGVILEVPTGAFADIVGRKTSLIIGKIGAATGFIIAVVFNATIPFIVGLMLANMMWSFISGSESSLVYDHLKENNRESEYAKLSSIGNTIYRIAIIIASFAGGYLFSIWIGLPLFIYALLNLIEAFLWLFAKEPQLDSEKFSLTGFVTTIKEGAKQVVRSPKVIYFTTAMIVFLSFTAVTNDFFNYNLAIDLGFDAQQQSQLFGFTAILKTISVIVIGYILIHQKDDNVVKVMYVVYILLLIPLFITNNLFALIFLILIDTFTAAVPVAFETILHRQFESKSRATAISFANMISTLILALLLIVGMRAIESYGSRIVFTVLGIVLTVFFTGLMIWMRQQTTKSQL